MQHWDPIGIKDVPECADEYDRYIDDIHWLLLCGAGFPEIAQHLHGIERRQMGLLRDWTESLGIRLFTILRLDQVSFKLLEIKL